MHFVPHFGGTPPPHQIELLNMLVREFQWAKTVELLDSSNWPEADGSDIHEQAEACAGRDLCMLMIAIFGPYLEDYPDLLPPRNLLRQKMREYSARANRYRPRNDTARAPK